MENEGQHIYWDPQCPVLNPLRDCDFPFSHVIFQEDEILPMVKPTVSPMVFERGPIPSPRICSMQRIIYLHERWKNVHMNNGKWLGKKFPWSVEGPKKIRVAPSFFPPHHQKLFGTWGLKNKCGEVALPCLDDWNPYFKEIIFGENLCVLMVFGLADGKDVVVEPENPYMDSKVFFLAFVVVKRVSVCFYSAGFITYPFGECHRLREKKQQL